MESNFTFRIDSQVKGQMTEICRQLGMTPSTAFNIFANAFVREKGMPFPVKAVPARETIGTPQALQEAEALMDAFSEDYRRMSE